MSDEGLRPAAEHHGQPQPEADNEQLTAANTAANSARNSPQTHSDPLPPSTEDEGGGHQVPASETPNVQYPPQPEQQQQQQPPPEMPQTQLTFLLVSGRRKTMSFEPNTTIGRVKELVWNAWPSEWQIEQPPAPAYLRVLFLGKILQDEDTLNTDRFRPNPAPPTIVHLSVRQIPIPSDSADALKKNKKRSRIASSGGDNQTGEGGGGQDDAGCCGGCVIC